MPLPSEIIYSDIPINLTSHPLTGDITRVTNDEAVKRSVKNLVLSKFYERPFQPFLGSDTTAYLFENFGPLTEQSIEDAIVEVITNYEPRVRIIEVRVNSQPDNNRFDVTLGFTILNRAEPVELDIFLERVR